MENTKAGALAARMPWIDLLRGMAMLLVIYGHQVGGWYGYFLLTSPIKIPLFFAISGYVFNDRRKSTRDFFEMLLWRLVIPWLALGLLLVAVQAPFRGMAYLRDNLRQFALGKAIWYIPCCIVAETIWFYIRRHIKNGWGIACAALACFAAGMTLRRFGLLNVFMINRALVAQAYLLIGYVYKRHGEGLKRRAPRNIAIAVAIYAVLALVSIRFYPGRTMDAHLNRYYNVFICQGMIWSGCLGMFMLFDRLVAGAPRWLARFGQNTLVIYILHSNTVRLPRHILALTGIGARGLWVALLLAVLLVSAGYCLAAELVNRFAPVLAGKRRPGRRAPASNGQ